MPFIKAEIQENEGFNTLVLSSRDGDEESLRQLDLIFHAVMSSQPKRGGAVPNANMYKVDVKTGDLIRELDVKLVGEVTRAPEK